MIAVVGEALIDLIISPSGSITAALGGGPFNVARTIGRLGDQPAFVGRLSADGFGQKLRTALDRDNVRLAVPDPVEVPTTLAMVDLDTNGVPRFRFYLAGTSAAGLDEAALAAALPDDLAALHVGTLGLVMEPIADSVTAVLKRDVPPDVLVMADPNCRPDAITDPEAYRARLGLVLHRANVVKVSTEDLAYLRMTPGALLDAGSSLVLVTDGPRPARALTRDADIEVPVPASQVVDTIGAGDAFGGAFLAWWTGHGLGVADLGDATSIRHALEAAVEVAAITCTRPGADPPWASEIPSWLAAPLSRGGPLADLVPPSAACRRSGQIARTVRDALPFEILCGKSFLRGSQIHTIVAAARNVPTLGPDILAHTGQETAGPRPRKGRKGYRVFGCASGVSIETFAVKVRSQCGHLTSMDTLGFLSVSMETEVL